jgi:hypothetical protein
MRRRAAGSAVAVLAGSLALPAVFALAAPGAPRTELLAATLAQNPVPRDYLAWYQQAARTCPGLRWEVLAGVGAVESDHGRSVAPGVHSGGNFAGAAGPMQFEPGTFAAYAVRPNANIYNPKDAIFAAARMLCLDGARGGSRQGVTSALLAYDPVEWYPQVVMSWAAKYSAAAARAGYRAHKPAAPRVRHIHPHPVLPSPGRASSPRPSVSPSSSPLPSGSPSSPLTAAQLSAEAHQLSAEAHQLSAEAQQLLAKAQQLSAAARKLVAEANALTAAATATSTAGTPTPTPAPTDATPAPSRSAPSQSPPTTPAPSQSPPTTAAPTPDPGAS